MKNPFEYQKPNPGQIARIETLRREFYELLLCLGENTELGQRSDAARYAALAKTSLEEAMMWASKSIVFEELVSERTS